MRPARYEPAYTTGLIFMPSRASMADGIAAMNGNMYSGGYSRGNFAFVGGKADGVDVNPDPCATLWGTTHSSQQNIYIAGALATVPLLQIRMSPRRPPLQRLFRRGVVRGPDDQGLAFHRQRHRRTDHRLRQPSWLKVPSTLFEDSASSASLDCVKARAAPTHPRAQPEQLRTLPRPQELASGRPKVDEFPLSTSRR